MGTARASDAARSAIAVRLAVLSPDVTKGVRAGLVTILPYYLTQSLHRPELAWVALGGWLGALADPGGARRTRAFASIAFIGLGGAAVALAALGSTTTLTASLALAAIVLVASLARALGANASSLGTTIAVAASIAASRAGSPTEAAWFAVGGMWYALTSTITWPLWPHRPLRLAIGQVFDRLADYVDAIAAARLGDWAELARTQPRPVRAAIEQARQVALALRARRAGETPAGANLRILLGAAEDLFFRVIALAEQVEHGGAVPASLAASLRATARDLYTRSAGSPVQLDGDTPLVDAARDAAELARDLDRLPAAVRPETRPPRQLARALRDAIWPTGPIFTHAMRVALLGAVAVAVGRRVTPSHPTWVTVTALAVLQPYLGPTLERALERVVGTILGAALAVVLTATVRSPLALAVLMFPLSVASVITKPRSYRLFVLFLTPLFVLVTDLQHADWHAAAERIGAVALGGVLALVAALIAPSRERPRLADALERVLAALGEYVELSTGRPARPALVAARRKMGVSLEEAEASLERMLAEPRAMREGVEDAMYIITYVRRLSARITSLPELGGVVPAEIGAYLRTVIDDVRMYVATGARAPARTPPRAGSRTLEPLVRRGELLGQIAAPPARSTESANIAGETVAAPAPTATDPKAPS